MIEERIRKNAVVIEPKGRLTVETAGEFNETVRHLLDTGRTRLVLNLADVTYIDSAGLGAIAQCYISARRRGGDLKLLHVATRNRDLLTLTKLLTVFEAYDSVEEAETSFENRAHSMA